MDDDEKNLRGIKGERCWDRRVIREEMIGSLLRARIMSGRRNGRIRKIG